MVKIIRKNKRKTTSGELIKSLEKYFKECEELRKAPTKGAMSMFVAKETGVKPRTALSYGELDPDTEEFGAIMDEAYSKIEEAWIQKLWGKNSNVAGTIFFLKNAFRKNWKEERYSSNQVSFSLRGMHQLANEVEPVVKELPPVDL